MRFRSAVGGYVMRLRAVWLVGLLPPLCGCNLFYYAGKNLVNEPVTLADERKLDKRLKCEADEQWRAICHQFPERTFTPEFADGFTDGYVDYLDIGGVPGPPAVPPLRYRRTNYLTPHGQALVRDYLTGFQYGAEVASATGKRQFLTVPVVLPESAGDEPLSVRRLPAPPDPAPPADRPVAGTPTGLEKAPPKPDAPPSLPVPAVPAPPAAPAPGQPTPAPTPPAAPVAPPASPADPAPATPAPTPPAAPAPLRPIGAELPPELPGAPKQGMPRELPPAPEPPAPLPPAPEPPK